VTDLFDWKVALGDISSNGVSGFHNATSDERNELARVLDIQACDSLTIDYKILPLRSGIYRLTGNIKADVVQACVVTLEPVASKIDEPLNVELRPTDMMPEGEQDVEEMSILETPDFEPIEDDEIDLGLLVLEHFSTAINPYPRAPGVELEIVEAGDTKPLNPFAVLGKLKG